MDWPRNNFQNITYALGETNSDGANLNMDQVEGVFGSALLACRLPHVWNDTSARLPHTHPK